MRAKSAIGFGVISINEFVRVPPRPSEEEIERQIHEAAVKLSTVQEMGYWQARDTIENIRRKFEPKESIVALQLLANCGMRSGKTSSMRALAASARAAGIEVQEIEPNSQKPKLTRHVGFYEEFRRFTPR